MILLPGLSMARLQQESNRKQNGSSLVVVVRLL